MSIERLQEIWPEWSVEGLIGEGSYGKVYRAVHVEQGVSAYAAIKVISIPQTRSEIDSLRSEGIDEEGTRTYFESVVNDFVNEIKLMHSFKGIQNIVSVEDFRVVEKQGEIGWDIFIRMELLTPFNTYMNDKNLDESDIIKLGIDICTALEICSKRNIIHRDIKTENIFVNDYGYFKLGDFGIARKMENMTGGLSQKGTFNYMAPEVANSTNYDARVDIYSLGIVLYRLLNHNRLPFLDADKQLLSPNDRRIAVERRMNGEPLYKQYTTLSGTISPYKEINSGTVRIYADDAVIRTFEVGKKTDPIQFSLNINGADYIKFEVDLLWASGVIISDVYLSNLESENSVVTVQPTPPGDTAYTGEPVSLASQTLIDSNKWSVNEGTPVDIFGNSHYSNYSRVLYNSNGTWEENGYFAEYRVYKQYTTLSGMISPYKEINSGTVRIYADDVVIQTFDVEKKTDPIQFSLDISGADYIKFEVDLLWASGVIISDVMLS